MKFYTKFEILGQNINLNSNIKKMVYWFGYLNLNDISTKISD